MIKLFINETPDNIEKLKKYCQEQDWPAVKKVAHPLKPKITYIGLTSMKDVISKIDLYAKEQKNLDQIPGLVSQLENTCSTAYKELQSELDEL